MDAKQVEKTQSDNFERMAFAVAVLYSLQLGLDLKKQDSWDTLTPSQKMFAKKIFEDNPELAQLVQQPERLTEQQIVESTADLAKSQDNAKFMRIVSVGDDRVCSSCAAWQDKIVCLDGTSSPTLEDAIDAGFLHYGCRCSLQEVTTEEIPLNKLNPRYETRKAANPAIYNSKLNGVKLVYN